MPSNRHQQLIDLAEEQYKHLGRWRRKGFKKNIFRELCIEPEINLVPDSYCIGDGCVCIIEVGNDGGRSNIMDKFLMYWFAFDSVTDEIGIKFLHGSLNTGIISEIPTETIMENYYISLGLKMQSVAKEKE